MKTRLFLVLLTLAFLTSCNASFAIGIEHTPSPAVTLSQVGPSEPGLTPIISIITSTPIVATPALPTPTSPAPSLPTPTTPPAAPTNTPGPRMVEIYLIGIGDNGQGGLQVGCGDSAIPVQAQIAPTQGVLRAALEKLLSIKDQFYGQSGLYNALYQSNLQVQAVTITNGVAHVELTGTMMLGGECDNPRVQAQLENTVLQFSTVTSAEIFINGKTLAEALSLK